MFMPVKEDSDEPADQLIHQRQNTLVAILSRAKPLTGQGFFNVDSSMIMSIIGAAVTYIIVLLQFNMSETQEFGKTSPTSFEITNVTFI